MDNKSKKNTIYSLIKSISAIVFPLITFPYSSRILGVDNFGKINFASSIVSYFALFASLGIATYAIRESAKVRDDKHELGVIASKFFTINLFSTLLSYFILTIALLVSSYLKQYLLLICILSFSIVFNTLGADWLNMAVGDFKYITFRYLAFNVLSIILMFVFVHNEQDYVIYALITVSATSGANILNIFYRRKFCTIKPTLHMDLKKHLPPIMLMFSIILVQEIFVSSDTTIIGFLLGDNAVGLYSAAVKVYRLPSAVTNSLTNVLLPTLAIAYSEKNIEQIKETQKYGINFLALIGFPFSVGLVIFSKEIIEFISGSNYSSASLSLSILGLSYFITLFGMVVTNFNLIARGKDKICLLACLASALINVALNFLLIPKYGIEAAAFTTALSHLVVLIIEIPFLNRQSFDKTMLIVMIKPFLCSLLLLGWLLLAKFFIKSNVLLIVVGVLFGAIFYFAANLLLKEKMTIDFCRGFVRIFKNKLKKG